jgi:hypothetical protein
MRTLARAFWTAGALAVLAVPVTGALHGHDVRVRRRPRVPDVAGFRTLLCDLHTHTVFSDGQVWPDARAEEAWREGYDAVAITDHIEYLPHAADLPPSHERSYEIAQPLGRKLDLLVIRGSEVTRSMPPGHLNGIFLRSVAPLDTKDWREALRRAAAQGAFVFWNHPGWRGHQRDGIARWYPEHQELVDQGLVQGIEVVTGREYYPEAHRLSIEKNLAPLANSDVHEPAALDYHAHEGDHRPATLVFARERTAESLKEALVARRTAAWSGEMLVGREDLLRPLFVAAVTLENPRIELTAGSYAYVRIRNDSDLRFELEGPAPAGPLRVPERVVIAAGGTSLLEIRAPRTTAAGEVRLDLAYRVANLRPAPGASLPVTLTVVADVRRATPGAP